MNKSKYSSLINNIEEIVKNANRALSALRQLENEDAVPFITTPTTSAYPIAPSQEILSLPINPDVTMPIQTETNVTAFRSFDTDKNYNRLNSYDEAMALSQKVISNAAVGASTAHAIFISDRINQIMREHINGIVNIHAGIISNFCQFFTTGFKQGQMDGGSKIFFGHRNGDYIYIYGYIPYAGLAWGNKPAARLLGRADQSVEIKNHIAFSLGKLGMNIPNMPFSVSRNTILAGFGVDSQQRQHIWKAIHEHMGWPL